MTARMVNTFQQGDLVFVERKIERPSKDWHNSWADGMDEYVGNTYTVSSHSQSGVYFKEDGGIFGFQLCYDLNKNEHAFTWRKDEGFAHNLIDDGEGTPFKNMTPILVPDGVFPFEHIRKKFSEVQLRHGPFERVALVSGNGLKFLLHHI